MNKLHKALLLLTLSIASFQAEAGDVKAGVVNFKTCIEQSKIGKKEQAYFETMKKQMETFLEEKEKNMTELSTKFNDADYMDSVSKETQAELKHNFRNLNQELSQLQNQYYQTLQQANVRILQKISDIVAQAAAKVAKAQSLNLVLNQEGAFYYDPSLDISAQVVLEMDKIDNDELKAGK